ncbi:MAG: DEAD/DEAH box helicase, partial [Theionarchaea archaeon]|nr:DEAD/DEAH box helicase [Theionarchaea archaeon]
MAGVPRALDGEKFYYLTPLVALANLRYSEFSSKYRDLGLKTAIRVGTGRIKTGRKKKLNTDIENADIIVGTYEGVEQVLRSGSAKRLGRFGVIAIDEIQNLSEEERGSRLDGLIKKLRIISSKSQFLYLSATVGNPEELAKGLRAALVLHDERPVPLERHLVPVSSPGQKIRLMAKLIGREFSETSVEGYRGQTLVFTNSRRRCHQLASALTSQRAPVSPYHSGLSYERRRSIEAEFVGQRIAAVATTAALAAGVDLPASQVIFETLAMGIEWISPAEFHQMLGRAGRLGFHGSGRAMLLIEPGRSCSRAERRTEDQVAIDLLSSGIEPVSPIYTHEDLIEQVLADVSTFGLIKTGDLAKLQDFSIGFSSSLKPIIEELSKNRMVRKRGDSLVITPIGRITSSFFLAVDEGIFISRSIEKGRDPLSIVTGTSVFERAYVSERLQKGIQQLTRRKTSTRFFDSDILELLLRPKRRPSKWFQEIIWRISRDLLRCGCRSSPNCDCPPRKLSEVVIELRISGMDPDEISSELFKRYGIEAYPGDLTEYLNDTVRLGEAIARFADVLRKPGIADRARDVYNRIIG